MLDLLKKILKLLLFSVWVLSVILIHKVCLLTMLKICRVDLIDVLDVNMFCLKFEKKAFCIC